MEIEEQISAETLPNAAGFRLTEDDIEILRLSREHRFLRRD